MREGGRERKLLGMAFVFNLVLQLNEAFTGEFFISLQALWRQGIQ
jgi:hypothetical protein